MFVVKKKVVTCGLCRMICLAAVEEVFSLVEYNIRSIYQLQNYVRMLARRHKNQKHENGVKV